MSEFDAKPTDYSQTPIDQLWAEWKVEYSKTYQTKEDEEYRFGIFKEKLERIQAQNAKYNSGESTHFAGLNQFSDLKHHEICCGGARKPPKKK